MAAQTFTLLAPNPGQIFDTRFLAANLVADNQGLIANVPLVALRDMVAQGCIVLGNSNQVGLNDAAAWNQGLWRGPIVSLAAIGATARGGALINAAMTQLTATTSAEGAQLKAIATGALSLIRAPTALNSKLYAPAGFTLDAAASTVAKVLTAAKGYLIQQTSSTHFVTLMASA